MSDVHLDPAGFRVYMNTTGAFGSNAPYVWVDYDEGMTTFSSSEVIPSTLDENTTYYWRVIPTTEHPEERLDDNRRNSIDSKQRSSLRQDAPDVQVWRFTTGTTSTDDDLVATPYATSLFSNYPNPFNPQTVISYSLKKDSDVRIDIYNSRGQLVKTLVDFHQDAGQYSAIRQGRNQNGESIGSGVYYYRMQAGCYSETKKMIMLR